ncbi:MAG: glycosyltransferase [Mogibacterium sp.]|nr:glycosyltransferase [Mogibacterium sp.]
MNSSVSVAMAVYNGEHFIRQQIDSILVQLNENDELVISYDNSNDNTLEIIREYESECPNVKVVLNSDPGVFGNFENAISHCSKDYIFISDQDDIWDPRKIETVVECFRKTGADMVIHSGKHIDKNNEIISESFFALYNIGNNLIRNFAKPRYSGCCTAFTKEFKRVILPIPRDVGAYDHWLGMTGEVLGKLVFLDEDLIMHRLHDYNVTPTSKRPMKVIISARFNLARHLVARRFIKKNVR